MHLTHWQKHQAAAMINDDDVSRVTHMICEVSMVQYTVNVFPVLPLYNVLGP